MKNDMEIPIILLVVVVILSALAWMWQGSQLDIAIASIRVQETGQQIPNGVLPAAELGVTWIVKAALGTVLAGAGTALVLKIWSFIKRQRNQKRYFYPQQTYSERAPSFKVPNERDLLLSMLYQQTMQQNGGKPPRPQIGSADDDEPEIVF